MTDWGKDEERLVVRAVDVLCGVLSGAPVEPARQVIASRALAQIELQLFPMHEESELEENTEAAAAEATDDQWTDDAAVRRWLAGVLHDHAAEYNDYHEVTEGDWGFVHDVGHPAWPLLELSPFSRRLRLLQDATAKTGAGLGRDIGVGAHQLGHWAAGRSRPGPAERKALASAFGIHPAWLDPSRDDQPDIELYRFRSCQCETAGTMTREGLGREEPDWYESAAEQAGAVRWCDGCGQPWLKDSADWLLPLPPGEETIPYYGSLADGQHPAIYVRHRSLDEAWPPVLWRPPHHPLKRTRNRTAYLVPSLLTDAPLPPAPAPSPPKPRGHVPSEEPARANASWCLTCQSLVNAPPAEPGGPWVLLHRSERRRGVSTWSYPSRRDAFHAAAHMAILGLMDDKIAQDLFADQAHEQVVARYLELHPDTDLFMVAELVPMSPTQF
ncbi:helix-turn-helix domain-containing protein [Streptomyces sp. bgisy154]|uniref:helix-turn-helix domain-containing protein n=1 Tax=Streptomyces sp. bgisy154 TaxID=3413794 RepID=UPI003D745A75